MFTPFVQIVQGNNAQATGLRSLPLIGGIVLGAVCNDRLLAYIGERAMLVLGLVICASGLAVLSIVNADTGFGLMSVALAVFGVGQMVPVKWEMKTLSSGAIIQMKV